MNEKLLRQFGNIDIYLFDQLLKGTFDTCKKVLDAGCGNGRNLVYLLQNGFEVYGIDQETEAIAEVNMLCRHFIPAHNNARFVVAAIEEMPFEDAAFDLVICNAVLHFARDSKHFAAMLQAMWRVLKPGGYFFARLASNIGIEKLVEATANGRYNLPDGTERFLVNEAMLLEFTDQLGAYLFEPIKTTNVQNMRCMTTWCMVKL